MPLSRETRASVSPAAAGSPSFHRFRVSRPQQKSSATAQAARRRASALNVTPDSTDRAEPLPPACQRCKHLKKKCSRTRPECEQCVHSAIECSYLAMAEEKNSITQLEAKVEKLTRFIEANLMNAGSSLEDASSANAANLPAPTERRLSFPEEQAVDDSLPASQPINMNGNPFPTSQSSNRIPNGYITSNKVHSYKSTAQGSGTASIADASGEVAVAPSIASTEAAANILTSMAPDAPGALQTNTGSERVITWQSSSDHFTPPASRSSAGPMTPITGRPLIEQSMAAYQAQSPWNPQITQPSRDIPRDAACFRFVDAYFRHVHRVYPFIDRKAILADRQKILDIAQSHSSENSTKIYLIMAIGCTTLQRSGQVPSETSSKFKIPYGDIVQKCLITPSIESVETLFLLALYSLFDPKGMPTWTLVGILTRQAMAAGITRRTTVVEGQIFQAELQNRLYWSVYVLDRMLSTTMGLPVSFIDEQSDVPLPGIALDERDQSELTSLQVCRHVIQLRQIEDTILKTIHLPNAKSTCLLNPLAKDAIMSDLRTQIENWYSQGCLISPAETDNIPFHNTLTWITVRYYNLLIFLYSPSHFTSVSSIDQHLELQRYAQKYIQSSCTLLQKHQLPLNWITLYRFLSICSILLYCFVRTEVEQGKPFLAQDEVIRCAKILESFPSSWTVASRSALVFRQLASLVAYTTSTRSGGGISGPSLGQASSSQKDSLVRKWFAEVKNGSMGLVKEVLGRNSAFCFTDYLIENSREVNDVQLLGGCRSILGIGNLSATSTASADHTRLGGLDVWEYDNSQIWDCGMEYF